MSLLEIWERLSENWKEPTQRHFHRLSQNNLQVGFVDELAHSHLSSTTNSSTMFRIWEVSGGYD